MPRYLVFDLGGSSLRLAITGADGRFLALVRKPLSIRSSDSASFEVDPLDWWGAFVDGCSELDAAGLDLAAVSAIAGCGFTRTQVFLDGSGYPVRRAITFQDSRSSDLLRELAADSPDAPLQAVHGLGPYDPLSRILWLKRFEPDNWSKVEKVVEPKDFLNLMLTGIAASDNISQTPITRALEASQGRILDALEINRRILPAAYSPFSQIGQVRPGLPGALGKLAGAPVHCGSIDTWSCVLGSGGLAPGLAYSISGTSDVFGTISDTPHSAAGLLTVEWGDGLWQLGGPSQGAATRLQWALDRFCPGVEARGALDDALAQFGDTPLFLPYLDGERTPWWNSDLRGAFFGLSTSHQGPDFVRAVAEGMNYLSREILSRAESATGAVVRHVCFSGGLASNSAICQLKADVLDRPVFVPTNSETGLMGAALIAHPDRSGMLDAEQMDGIFYHPTQDRRQYHDDHFRVFQEASALNAGISSRIAQLNRPATDG